MSRAESGTQPWKKRLPHLFGEAAFVFLAVFLALVAEEWQEDRDRQELADRALRGIIHEIRSNLDELERNEQLNRTNLEQLSRAAAEMERGVEIDELSVNYNVALTSSAAWDAARMSQAVHYLDLEVMTSLAELYEVQSLYERAQHGLVDRLADLGSRLRVDRYGATQDSLSRLSTLMEIRQALSEAYEEALAEVGEPSSIAE